MVNPGGQAQTAHRDYHLGFMDAAAAARFPAHVHRLSPALTLQGAVAHCDMPVETGPTLYLPYSQQYEPGYLAFHLPEFTEYFQANYVQLPLEKGDAAFFNPALFHGAGTNVSTDVRRMANLLQVSSAVRPRHGDRRPGRDVPGAVPGAAGSRRPPARPSSDLDNVIAASAEGYAFPTNLDRDQPIDGLAPQTQADLVRQALAEEWTQEAFESALDAQAARTLPRPPNLPAHGPHPCLPSCSPPAGPTPGTRCRWQDTTSARWTSAPGQRPWPPPASLASASPSTTSKRLRPPTACRT